MKTSVETEWRWETGDSAVEPRHERPTHWDPFTELKRHR